MLRRLACRRLRECVVCIVVVLILSGLATACSSMRTVTLFLRIVGGPITGWLEAIETHALPDALQLLLPFTLLTLGLLSVYARNGSKLALGGAGAAWFVSGVTFTIGVAA